MFHLAQLKTNNLFSVRSTSKKDVLFACMRKNILYNINEASFLLLAE